MPAAGWPPGDVDGFVDDMVRRHGFDAGAVRGWLGNARPSEAVLELMNPAKPPAYRKVWREYRTRFIEPIRIGRGTEFWARNAQTLARAEQTYGVPARIIVAIIGVETVYGRNTGNFRLIDSLSTLAFRYPPRAPYFRGELEQFLLFARENRVDPLSVNGSYAGAVGIPQFMPTSIRQFAVDFDGNGSIDLSRSETDAIGSVARFLKLHGWVPGLATHYPVTVPDLQRARPAIARGPEPRDTRQSLQHDGIVPDATLPADEPVVLADLVNGDEAAPDFVLGTRNFHAITRYNRSYFYAMSVIELAQAIERARDEQRQRGEQARRQRSEQSAGRAGNHAPRAAVADAPHPVPRSQPASLPASRSASAQ